MNPTDINRILEEYQIKLALYNDFCLTMNNLLIYLLMDKAYKYQISSRLKYHRQFEKETNQKEW